VSPLAHQLTPAGDRLAAVRMGRIRRLLINSAAAVGNALSDALAPLGIRDIPMPATPERLWRAIRTARGW
jgi:hypothetical protein